MTARKGSGRGLSADAVIVDEAFTLADQGRYAVSTLVDEWWVARAVQRELERAAHPDITDRFGRVWTWKDGDLYTHDNTLAFPLAFIDDRIGLPRPGLADENPNYAGLCAICRHEGGAS